MKKFYFSLVLALLFSFSAYANNVIVKGYVKYGNGTPVVNQQVHIFTDSANTPAGCYQYKTAYTNANGFYIDTLLCNSGNLLKFYIYTIDNCGNPITQTVHLTSPVNVVERNFTFSCTVQQGCHADFVFTKQNLTVSFQSTSTSAPGTGLSYQWLFGDGSTGTGVNPTHTYNVPGTYNVKLIIAASNGCVDSVSRSVTVGTTTSCHAHFVDSMIAPNKFVFNSLGSTFSPGTSIIQRIWTFGDGTGNNGNLGVIDHVYQQSGTYNVCLKIVTSSGCMDTVCKTITVVVPPSNCVSQFTWTKTPLAIGVQLNFNSSASGGATSTDSIISRYWTFGDGQHLTGNVINPTHLYTIPGNYQVCLKITTASGCQKTECKTIYLSDTSCNANFNYNIGNGGTVYFTNTSSTLGTNTQYNWHFGNLGTSTAINPVFTFPAGSHFVWLSISTSSGCSDSIGKMIHIAPPATNCEAAFQFSGLAPTAGSAGYKLQFNSTGSHGTSAPYDTIISRTWIWGDGSYTGGNVISPAHTYANAATYNVCLVIQTASGCSDTTCKTVTVPMQNQLVCQSKFLYEHLPSTNTGKVIRFNSSMSYALPGDSIISRKWQFGDGTSLMTGNVVSPMHVYPQPGTYNVCLTITTALGCVRTECKMVVIPQVAGNCVPHFTWTKTGPKQITFNSSSSWVPANDSIIERKWFFGDASPVMPGNVVAPVHNYLHNGIYTVALKIRTALNCEKTFYAPVFVQDSIFNPPTQDRIKILSLYPSPATYQMQAVVWSLQNNIQAELAVYDVYGNKKWSMNKVLFSGNNVTVVPTGFLSPGPYYFRVTTIFGVKSKAFFKQ